MAVLSAVAVAWPVSASRVCIYDADPSTTLTDDRWCRHAAGRNATRAKRLCGST
jgi:hypothetical protein